MNILKPNRLAYFKRQASDLLRSERSTTDVKNSRILRLKHALHIVAREAGYTNWTSLKNDVVLNDCLYRSRHVGLIHSWFKSYQEAEQYFIKNGGYLLRFWGDFVVCGPEYIKALNLDQYKDEWAKAGYNLVKPTDLKSGELLLQRAKENYLKQQ